MKTQKLISKLFQVVVCLSLSGSTLLPSTAVHAEDQTQLHQEALDIVQSLTQTVEKQDTLTSVVVAKQTLEEVILVRDGETFRIPAPLNSELLKGLYELNPAQQMEFLKRRTFVLEKMLSLLHWRYLKEGKGAILGQKIVQDQNTSVFKEADMSVSSSVRDEIIEGYYNEFHERVKAEGGEAALFKKTAHEFIAAKLKMIDENLFRYVGIATNPKEMGFTLTMGLSVGAGAIKKIWGRAHLLSINIGIDFESKSLVFEISRVSERYRTAITPVVATAAIPVSAGVYMKNPSFEGVHRGHTTTLPGAPVGISGYSNYAEGGLSFGLPPIIFDYFGFISVSQRSRVLRLEISPLRLAFLKVEVGSEIKSSLVSVKQMVHRWFSPKGGASCRRLYTAS